MSKPSLIKRAWNAPLHLQIIAAMILGLTTGAIFEHGFGLTSGALVEVIKTLGTIFVRLLRMVIVPLVVSSIIVGVSGVSDPSKLGRLGSRTLFFYAVTSTLGAIVGLSLSNLIKPGTGVSLGQDALFDPQNLSTPDSMGDVLIRMIPINPLQSMVESDMLGMIFFAMVFGIALTRLPESPRASLTGVIDAFFQAMMKLTLGVVRLAPFGVYGLIFRAYIELPDPALFKAILTYMGVVAAGLSIHLFVSLPLLLFITTRRNPLLHYRHMLDAILTAFSTSSSSATLPVTLECVEKKAGVPNRISSFVLPLGSTVNMDGTAMYECVAVLFIAQVLGVELSFAQQITVILTALLASVGAAGIPSAGLVMIFIVLDAVGIQGEQVGFIVGTMLAVDRPLDMYRTVINVFGDSVCAVIVSHGEEGKE